MLCKRCDKPLVGKQTSYCSSRCSRLHLKSMYKKRNREKVLAYNRSYRSLGLRPLAKSVKDQIIADRGGFCTRCGSVENLNIHHFKPLRYKGSNKRFNLQVLCFQCHMELEKRMRGYWDMG